MIECDGHLRGCGGGAQGGDLLVGGAVEHQHLVEVLLKDVEAAAAWLRRAAESGHAHAQFQLAVMHCTGEGVAVDLEEAVRLYAAAAESGHVEAMYNLGVMQMKGMGTEADPEKGMAWVRTAASNGLKAAQAIVGGAESAAR